MYIREVCLDKCACVCVCARVHVRALACVRLCTCTHGLYSMIATRQIHVNKHMSNYYMHIEECQEMFFIYMLSKSSSSGLRKGRIRN